MAMIIGSPGVFALVNNKRLIYYVKEKVVQAAVGKHNAYVVEIGDLLELALSSRLSSTIIGRLMEVRWKRSTSFT